MKSGCERKGKRRRNGEVKDRKVKSETCALMRAIPERISDTAVSCIRVGRHKVAAQPFFLSAFRSYWQRSAFTERSVSVSFCLRLCVCLLAVGWYKKGKARKILHLASRD